MMKGVQLQMNRYRKCLRLVQTNLLDKNFIARSHKFKPHIFKNTHVKNIFNRPKWRESNATIFYYKYFGAFNLETFLHTFSYIADYLKLIYYETLYENEYLTYYMIRYSNNNKKQKL
jgi:hypothetical protein